jgi:glycosyltransferase involved in cell wall biosynthesis
MIEALVTLPAEARGLVVGFGTHREWLAALVIALETGDAAALEWLRPVLGLDLAPEEAAGEPRVEFTGRLDHRYAPLALAAMDVLVVPSMLAEAFGMVAAEAAAAGALPLVARHSSLVEVAAALEGAVGRPGLLSFEPGPGATHNLAASLRRILALDSGERAELKRQVSRFVASEWTWEHTADLLLEAAGSA